MSTFLNLLCIYGGCYFSSTWKLVFFFWSMNRSHQMRIIWHTNCLQPPDNRPPLWAWIVNHEFAPHLWPNLTTISCCSTRWWHRHLFHHHRWAGLPPSKHPSQSMDIAGEIPTTKVSGFEHRLKVFCSISSDCKQVNMCIYTYEGSHKLEQILLPFLFKYV
jgi:hypothetical protein